MLSNVLFIVYYLPPMGGSGVQRPLKFIKYLSYFDWHPVVLAPEPGAYHTFDQSLLEELEEADATVVRIDADTPFHRWTRTMNLLNKLPLFLQRWLRSPSYGLMLPDNKKGWIKPALNKAEQLIREYDIELIFSTAPPYSNHCIAAQIGEKTQLPVIMDFRDDWLESQLIEYPTRWHKRKMARLEKETVSKADLITGLDSYMLKRFRRRWGDQLNYTLLPHGYDPADFNRKEKASLQYDDSKLNLLYSGIFIHHNQPDSFLTAVKRLMDRLPVLRQELKLHFQGGLSKRHWQLIDRLNLGSQVVDYGYLPHQQAVANLQHADAVWFLSNFGSEHKQVKSGKLFEYMGSGKPILGLIFEGGEEERLLKRYGASYIASPDDPDEAANMMERLYKDWKTGSLPQPDRSWVSRFDRFELTRNLAELFNSYTRER
jgi:glycosyltransferase involved in cell wall biosynthesis